MSSKGSPLVYRIEAAKSTDPWSQLVRDAQEAMEATQVAKDRAVLDLLCAKIRLRHIELSRSGATEHSEVFGSTAQADSAKAILVAEGFDVTRQPGYPYKLLIKI